MDIFVFCQLFFFSLISVVSTIFIWEIKHLVFALFATVFPCNRLILSFSTCWAYSDCCYAFKSFMNDILWRLGAWTLNESVCYVVGMNRVGKMKKKIKYLVALKLNSKSIGNGQPSSRLHFSEWLQIIRKKWLKFVECEEKIDIANA